MDATFWNISLAALIHDVGKIGQRAFPSRGGLSEQSLRMIELLCPKSGDPRNPQSQYHTHLHVLYTNEFLNLVEKSLPDCFDASQVVNLAVKHHLPETEHESLLADADRLASAIERIDPPEFKTSEERSAFRKTRLIPICGQIQLDKREPKSDYPNGHRITAWENDSSVLFPDENAPAEESEWKSIWDSLLDRWKRNAIQDPWQFMLRALGILEELTWCVPSATNAFPDISLYDHSRAVSAIAGCLYKAEDKNAPFLLAAGDFSGIQKYMFDIKHGEGEDKRKPAKLLRGRSFTVRLFVEHVVFHILHRLQIPLTHRIIAAGGRMYLLLPNCGETVDTLESAAESLDEWSLDATNGQLRFNLGWDSMDRAGIKDFGGSLIKVNDELVRQTKRSLSRRLISGGWTDEFLRPKVDLSGKIAADEQDMGQRLPKSEGAAFSLEADDKVNRFPFGSFRLVGSKDSVPSDRLITLNWGNLNAGGGDPACRSRLAHHVPLNENGELQTFEDIAGKASGRSALGFVKADVDNLGFVLSSGFKGGGESQDRTSISRIATLSRALEGFFSGYVDNLIEKRFPSMYLVYSGGDDLFAVGPWDQALDFITTLREEFGRYVEGNPDWGLSAGVYVGNPKTPILQAADQAEDELEKSKQDPKDQLTVFGQTLNWNDARSALDRGAEILSWLNDGVVSVSQIRRLMTCSRMFDEYHTTKDTANLRYVYLLIYDLKRNWKDKTDEEKRAKTWAHRLADPNFDDLPLLTVSCHYALYGIRGG